MLIIVKFYKVRGITPFQGTRRHGDTETRRHGEKVIFHPHVPNPSESFVEIRQLVRPILYEDATNSDLIHRSG